MAFGGQDAFEINNYVCTQTMRQTNRFELQASKQLQQRNCMCEFDVLFAISDFEHKAFSDILGQPGY